MKRFLKTVAAVVAAMCISVFADNEVIPNTGSISGLGTIATQNSNTVAISGGTVGPHAAGTLAATNTQLNISQFNSGTAADATTFWRGDGTWVAAGGSGQVVTNANNLYAVGATNYFDVVQWSKVIDSGSSNFIYTLINNTNLFIGSKAGSPTSTGVGNMAIGYEAGKSMAATASGSTYVGYQAGKSVTDVTGNNTVLGAGALDGAAGGTANTIVGQGTGKTITGSYNTIVGQNCGPALQGVNRTTIVGYNSVGATTSDVDSNAIVGGTALNSATSIKYTCALGYYAGYGQARSVRSIWIGYDAGDSGTGSWTNCAVIADCQAAAITPEQGTFIIGNADNNMAFCTNTARGAKMNVAGSCILGTSGVLFSNLTTVTMLTNFGTVNAGTTTSLPLTLTGAKVNDAIALRLPLSASNEVVWTGVASNNTIWLRAFNPTAANINLSADAIYGASVISY